MKSHRSQRRLNSWLFLQTELWKMKNGSLLREWWVGEHQVHSTWTILDDVIQINWVLTLEVCLPVASMITGATIVAGKSKENQLHLRKQLIFYKETPLLRENFRFVNTTNTSHKLTMTNFFLEVPTCLDSKLLNPCSTVVVFY